MNEIVLLTPTAEMVEKIMAYRQEFIDRKESRHDPNNPHSGDVMKKCGIKYEGTLRQANISNKGIVDACMYSILREEWRKK
mgnify:CR=1 FL=1